MGVNKDENNLAKAQNNADINQEAVTNIAKHSEALKSAAVSVGDFDDKLDDGTEALEAFSETIHTLPASIHGAIQTMNKNMAYMSKDLKTSFLSGIIRDKAWSVRAQLGKETEELRQAFEDSAKHLEEARNTGDARLIKEAEILKMQAESAYMNRKNTSEASQLNKKFWADAKTVAFDTLKNAFSGVVDYWKDTMNSAYTDMKSVIQNTYSDINARQNYDHAEYAKLVERLGNQITELGLDKVVNTGDLLEGVKASLGTGLSGATAELNALYAAIAERSGITFDWYSTEWTQTLSMIQSQGKAAGKTDEQIAAEMERMMQTIVQTTESIETTYGGDATGLAQGKAQQIMSYAADARQTYNLDDAAFTNMYQTLAVTSQELSKYGIESSAIIQDIGTLFSKGINEQDANVIFAGNGITGAEAIEMMQSGQYDKLVTNYIQNLQDMYKDPAKNPELLKALTSNLGGSLSEADYQKLANYTESEGAFGKNLEKVTKAELVTLEEMADSMEDSTLKSEQHKNEAMNKLDEIAVAFADDPQGEIIATEMVKGFSQVAGLLWTLITKQAALKFSDMLSNKLSGGSGGSSPLGNKSSNLFSKIGSKVKSGIGSTGNATVNGSGLLGKLASKGYSSAAMSGGSSIGGASGGMAALNGAAAYAAPVALAAGVIMGGVDSYNSFKSANEDGKITAVETGNALKSFITGHDANKSGDDKLAQVRKGGLGGIDWGSAAKNAGKGALIGGGIGGIAGSAAGGIGAAPGMAIGAAIGAVTGFVTNLIDQAVDLHNYNKYAKSEYGKLGETMKKNLTAVNDLASDYAEYNQMLLQKTDLETQLNEARKTGSGATKQEIALLELEIMEMEQKIKLKQAELGSVDDVVTKLEDSVKTLNESKSITTALTNIDSTINKEGWDTKTNWKDVSDEALEAAISDEQLKAFEAAGMKSTGDSRKDRIGLIQMTLSNGKGDVNFKGEDYDQDIKGGNINWSMLYGGANSTMAKDMKKQTTELESSIAETITTTQQNLAIASDANTNEELQNYIQMYIMAKETYLNSLFPEGKELTDARNTFVNALAFSSMMPNLSENRISEYEKWLKSNSKAKLDAYKPFYATGTTGEATIPYDNYLAYLHEGEQIRTKAEVTVERAEQHVASSDAITKVHDVVLTQTNTIISILTNIYSILSNSYTATHTDIKLTHDLPGI